MADQDRMLPPRLERAHRPRALSWDVFCRVVDNYGDIGVCWRLATHLAALGDTVRLFVDDASALAWMAPQGAAGVHVLPWPEQPVAGLVPSACVVEAFGCDPPVWFVERMAQRRPEPPLWTNLEYLSAEDYVERSHGLPSPQRDGQTKWFFYPGFTALTGGLLGPTAVLPPAPTPALAPAPNIPTASPPAAASRWDMLPAQSQPRPGEQVLSVFCYGSAPLQGLVSALGAAHQAGQPPSLLLLTPGQAQRLGTTIAIWPAGVRAAALPWLTQAGYDTVLQACDFNCVRGEDSLVRAIWARKPFLWHIYPQSDGAHAAKLAALAQRVGLAAPAWAWWQAWNGLPASGEPMPVWPSTLELSRWADTCGAFAQALALRPGLAQQLRSFAMAKLLTSVGPA